MSISSEAPATPTPAGVRQPTKLLVCAVLAVAAAVAINRMYVVRASSAIVLDNSEQAVEAMDAKLRATPANQRVEMLIDQAAHGGPGMRYAAVDALGDQHGEQAEDAIERSFTDSSAQVRQRAMEVLQKLDGQRGLKLLLQGAVDEDQWIRQFAAQNLIMFSDKHSQAQTTNAVPTLIRMLDDRDEMVQFFAVKALCKATVNDWSYRANAPAAEKQSVRSHWKQWWTHASQSTAIPAQFASVTPVRPNRADPAPDFSLTDVDGHSRSLQSQHGRLTLLNFWSTTCGPCIVEAPALGQLDKSYHGRGLDVIGVAVGEKGAADDLRSWCSSHGDQYSQAFANAPILNAYGDIHEVPISFLIDQKGRIRYQWEGERDYNTFAAAVDNVLATSK